jgi:homoserine dehydrogenase
MLYGRGAGKLPTASAVVADIIDVISAMDKESAPIEWVAATQADMADMSDYSCRRVFICRQGTSLPECAEIERSVCTDGVCAYLCKNAMSESDTAKLAEKLGDAFVCAYRVL